VDDLYLRLVKHLDLGEPVRLPFRTGTASPTWTTAFAQKLTPVTAGLTPLPNSPVVAGEEEAPFLLFKRSRMAGLGARLPVLPSRGRRRGFSKHALNHRIC